LTEPAPIHGSWIIRYIEAKTLNSADRSREMSGSMELNCGGNQCKAEIEIRENRGRGGSMLRLKEFLLPVAH
jgi:hypothetical protein